MVVGFEKDHGDSGMCHPESSGVLHIGFLIQVIVSLYNHLTPIFIYTCYMKLEVLSLSSFIFLQQGLAL